MKTKQEKLDQQKILWDNLESAKADVKSIEQMLKENATEPIFEDSLNGQIQSLEIKTQTKITSLIAKLNIATGREYKASLVSYSSGITYSKIPFPWRYDMPPFMKHKSNIDK